MTTGHPPSSDDYDATTALSRFASPQDLERIAETRPDLHSILATNPSIPPRVRAILEQSDDAVVHEVLARQAGRNAQTAQPTQPPAPDQIDPMAPTMAVGTGGIAGTRPPQPAPAGSGYGQAPQSYGSSRPSAPAPTPRGNSVQGTAPQGYGIAAAQPQQSPPPQDPSQADQHVALPPSVQPYSAPSMQSAAQPLDQQTAMPPGVAPRTPSGFGQEQPMAQGQAYGPSQAVAPAYGAPMYPTPAQPRKRRALKVLAVILPVTLLLGAGGVAAWYFLWRSNVALTSQFITPSDSWANGADKAWSADVTSDLQPYVVGNRFLTLDRSDGTLTGYTPLGSNMKEAWQTTLDDEDLRSTYGSPPSFQSWGDNTLVYKSTLVDLKTGDTSTAPWGDDHSALIAGNTAIFCKASDKCTAWDANKKQKWSREIPGAGESSTSTYTGNEPVVTRNNHHYTTLYNVVINIDSGEPLILGGGSKANSDLTATIFQDGWGTFEMIEESDSDSKSPSTRYKVTVYDFKGKRQSSYEETLSSGERAVLKSNEVLTSKQYRAYFKDKDYSEATLTATSNSDGCVTKVKPKNGNSITVPQPEEGSDYSYGSDSPGCPSGVITSENNSIVKLATWGGDINDMQIIMNVKTGKEITFSGIDWKRGDSLIVASPDLIIGYDKDDGKVIGFKPAS